jgi:hypothetical protein
LLNLNALRQPAGQAENPQLLEQLQTLAAERQQLLLSFIEDNPGKVLRLSLPGVIARLVSQLHD